MLLHLRKITCTLQVLLNMAPKPKLKPIAKNHISTYKVKEGKVDDQELCVCETTKIVLLNLTGIVSAKVDGLIY